MIKISNISGEIKSEIGSPVQFYSIRKLSFDKFLNKGVFGTKLANLLNETHSIASENLNKNLGIQKKDGSGPDIPMKYEDWIILQKNI